MTTVDQAVQIAREWANDPAQAVECVNDLLGTFTKLMQTIIEQQDQSELRNSHMFQPSRCKKRKMPLLKVALWEENFDERGMITAIPQHHGQSACLKDLVTGTEQEFILLGRIQYSAKHLELRQEVFSELNIRGISVDVPFDAEFRAELLAAAFSWFSFRIAIQTVQDVYGGYPFDTKLVDTLIGDLRELGSAVARPMIAEKVQDNFYMLMRESLRLARWVALTSGDETMDTGRFFPNGLRLFNHPDECDQTDDVRHSPDFRSVNWYGKQYTFTTGQADVVQKLWKVFINGTPTVSGEFLVAAGNVRDVFKVKGSEFHSAWGTMIQKDGANGFMLVVPDA